MNSRALLVVTSHATLGSTGRPTGYWVDELSSPYAVLTQAGVTVDIASIQGGRPPVDPASGAGEGLDPELDGLLESTPAVADVDAEAYDAAFLVGGHGTMWDFPGDTSLAAVVSSVARRGVVAAVCHGVAGLLQSVDEAGQPLLAGRRVTGFSDQEEELVGATSIVPFLLQRRLAEAGALVEVGEPFASHVVRDGRVVTGQNPQSSTATAHLLLDALRART